MEIRHWLTMDSSQSIHQGKAMTKHTIKSAKSLQAGYLVVGSRGLPFDVSPLTTVRRSVKTTASVLLGLWLLSVAGVAIA